MTADSSALVVALLQMDCVEGERERNVRCVESAAREAHAAGADLLALPELWCSGYDLASATRETWGEEELAALRELSRDPGIAILGGSLLQPAGGLADSGLTDDGSADDRSADDRSADDRSADDGTTTPRYANRFTAYEGGRQVASYDKAHLFAPLDEPRYLCPGPRGPAPFDLRGWRGLTAICYDLRFPELFRSVAGRPVDFTYVPAQWPAVRIGHWRTLLEARAIESQSYVIAVNRRGDFRRTTFGGHSRIIDPWGESVLEMEEGEGLGYATIERRVLEEARSRLPVLDDRRGDLFGDGERS